MSAQMTRLLTTAEAAELLQLKEGTLREHTAGDWSPSSLLGRQIRYDAADLAAWLDSIKQPAHRGILGAGS